MSKFNTTRTRPAVHSPVVTQPVATGRTYEGAPGYARDAKGELFLLAIANMVGEDTFYEKAGARDARYEQLVAQVAVADPAWTLGFLRWLRTDANMRSASLVGAAEAVKARLAAGVTTEPGATSRQLVDAVLQRADEPGEFLAYWTSHHGRAIPKPVKRGVGDALGRLYNERSLLKYDTDSHGFRFGDVVDLVHPTPVAPWQGDLFTHALDRRHGRDTAVPASLRMITMNRHMRAAAADDPGWLLANPDRVAESGMTWEDVLSLAGSKVNKAKLWEIIIPSMGYMALLRNLRNFDEAGIPDGVAHDVMARLTDPAQVAKSRQFPYRFLAAHEQVPSLRWGHALEVALNLCLSNVPSLPGRTLVLIDTSMSMTTQRMSARSTMTAAKAAAVFGVVLAARCGADLYGFADGVFRHELPQGASTVREVERFVKRTGEVGHGTQIAASLRATYQGHSRVVVISDMQTFNDARGDVTSAVPANVPMYGFNLGGYRMGAMPTGSGNRHELGGLTDATFRLIPLLERGRDAGWPWE